MNLLVFVTSVKPESCNISETRRFTRKLTCLHLENWGKFN